VELHYPTVHTKTAEFYVNQIIQKSFPMVKDMGETVVEAPVRHDEENAETNPAELDNIEDVKLAKEMQVKHPLQNKWALWFFKNDKNKSWHDNLRLITTFESVEDFWGVYNHIQLASKLGIGCDYSLFKDGIRPMWEDDRNRNGGRWLVNINKNHRQQELDRLWLETLLCLIGEAFGEDSDQVCGAVVNIRHKGDKLAVWTGIADNGDSVMKIGRQFKERLTLPPKTPIVYEKHSDTSSKTGSQSKSKFTL